METLEEDPKIHGIDLPDIPLFAIWAVQRYGKNYGLADAAEKYTALVADLLDFILDGKHPKLQVEESGLVYTDGTIVPASWMNSVWDGRPVVPRTGLLVEINALWYNALMFAASLTEENPEMAERRSRWMEVAEKAKEAFVPTFLNDYGYLYDWVNGNYSDPSVRPNMIIATGLDYSPLDRRQRKGVLDVVTRELLTPKGLRTLSPKSYGYHPNYLGSPEERERALHNGPARPWLMAYYADTYLKVFGHSGASYIDRMLIGFEEDMSNGCIGSLSQLYDGNPPYANRGAISHATNIAEVLRTIHTLKKFLS
jgi:predicted glycogen debranching enzyme